MGYDSRSPEPLLETGVNTMLKGIAWVAVSALLAGCAGTAAVHRSAYEPGHPGVPFGNVLVIAVANDYDGRAAFERELVTHVRDLGADADAYYRIAGNQPELTRELVESAVRAGGFDAVLLTRVADSDFSGRFKRGSAETKATTVGGNVFNLFRYDYTELNEPRRVDFSGSVSLTTELYAVSDETVVWAVDTESSGHAGLDEMIEVQGKAIAAQLRRDRLIAR